MHDEFKEREVERHPPSGEKALGDTTGKFWEQEATDGISKDVTLSELVQIMKWDHACKPHQSKPSPQLYVFLCNNK